MANNNIQSIRSEILDSEYIESILNILDKELAASTGSGAQPPSDEIDLLVADLLGYLKIQD